MSKKWTLAQIKVANEKIGHCYFSPGTLLFFGQTMESFHVYHAAGRVFVASWKHRGWPSPGLATFAEFDPDTGKLDSVEHPDGIGKQWKRAEVRYFLADLRAAA